MDLKIPIAKLQKLMTDLDTDKDGCISVRELVDCIVLLVRRLGK